MGRIEKSIEIKAPPVKVWEMLAFDRYLEWDEGTKKSTERVEYTSEIHNLEDKLGVGATANFYGKNGRLGFVCEVIESVKNEKVAYYTSLSPVKRIDISYFLEPVEKGTKLTYRSDYEMLWGIFGKFLDTLFAQRMLGKEIEKSLKNLKSIVEK